MIVRPTSETIVNSYFSKWIQSYRDLPLLINQWANVVRWELRPRLFLRTTEFLWQEGHTAHATEAEARQFALRVLHEVYEDFMVNVLAIPVVSGAKTDRERFAGATTTWTCEAMMRDGKALQMGTSHELGQNFSRAFDTSFQDDAGDSVFVWQTSWGVSTRLMGALVMAHGDDAGLRVPPRLAPTQAVVMLVRGEDGAGARAAELAAELVAAGVRARLDARTDTNFGRRIVEWELKGVPVRIEVGPRDLAADSVVLARRDTGRKETIPISALVPGVTTALDEIQTALEHEADDRRRRGTVDADTLDEAIEAAQTGFATLPAAALGADGETKLNQAGVSVRLPAEATAEQGRASPDPGATVGRLDDLLGGPLVGRQPPS